MRQRNLVMVSSCYDAHTGTKACQRTGGTIGVVVMLWACAKHNVMKTPRRAALASRLSCPLSRYQREQSKRESMFVVTPVVR